MFKIINYIKLEMKMQLNLSIKKILYSNIITLTYNTLYYVIY